MVPRRKFKYDPHLIPDDQTRRIHLWFRCLKSAYRYEEIFEAELAKFDRERDGLINVEHLEREMAREHWTATILKEALEDSSEFYAPRGGEDIKHKVFKDWWPEHKHLFDITAVKNASGTIEKLGAVMVEIPVWLPEEDAYKQMRAAYHTAKRTTKRSQFQCDVFDVDIRESDYNTWRLWRGHNRIRTRHAQLSNSENRTIQPRVSKNFLACIREDLIARRSNGEENAEAPRYLGDLVEQLPDLRDERGETIRKQPNRAIKAAESMIVATAYGGFPGPDRNDSI